MSSIHTLNSKGEFPLYVNPFDCSCITCRTYIGEEQHKEYPCLVGAGAGWNYRGPQPRSWGSKDLQPRSWGSKDLQALDPSTEEESLPPPAVRLVRVNAFTTATASTPSTPGGGAGARPRPIARHGYVFEEEEAELASQLKSYRLTLLNQREDVYCMTPDSDDEANLQTTTWDTLTEKIRAIDTLLGALNQ